MTTVRSRPKVFREPVQEIQEIQEKRITKIEAFYNVSVWFKIPEGITLLTAKESEECNYDKPFSWWVRWDQLSYIDADGKTVSLGYGEECSDDRKHPEKYEEHDSDEEEEE